MPQTKALTDTLEILEDETTGSEIMLSDIIEALNHRGFGPLLMAPALLTILPTGAVPGIPIFSALIIFLIAGQIIAGRHYPWMPKYLRKFSFKRDKLVSAIAWAKPYTKIIDRYVQPRLTFFSQKLFQVIIALVCCLLAAMIAMIGFVPFMPALICIPILFFALGISAKDGIMIISGFVFTLFSAVLILWLAGLIDGKDRLEIGQPVFINQATSFISLNNMNKI